MAGDEWKKMERVIPVASWTNLDMSGDKEERKGREKKAEKILRSLGGRPHSAGCAIQR